MNLVAVCCDIKKGVLTENRWATTANRQKASTSVANRRRSFSRRFWISFTTMAEEYLRIRSLFWSASHSKHQRWVSCLQRGRGQHSGGVRSATSIELLMLRNLAPTLLTVLSKCPSQPVVQTLYNLLSVCNIGISFYYYEFPEQSRSGKQHLGPRTLNTYLA